MRTEELGRLEQVMRRERRGIVLSWLVFVGITAILMIAAWLCL